jgi:hypothetical protein
MGKAVGRVKRCKYFMGIDQHKKFSQLTKGLSPALLEAVRQSSMVIVGRC